VQTTGVGVTWVVGFSGGLDSTVLLHRFASSINAQPNPDLRREGIVAVYVNHQLQSSADGWAKHCQTICAQLKVAFVEVKLAGKPASAESVEAWARNGRMKALSDEAKKHPNPTILLAHHAQDQVETFLYRALRGSGATGLASMQSTSNWHGVPVQRPLINENRVTLANYAQAQALKWIEDPSNKDERLARNAIRAQVIPSLKKVMPDATARIMKSVQSLADDAAVLAEIGASDFQSCAMSAAAMGALSEARQANALRAWVRTLGLPLPSRAVVQEMQGQLLLLGRKYTHSGQVSYAGWLWTRYRDRLEVARLPSDSSVDWFTPPSSYELRWQVMAGPERRSNLAPGFAASCRATELVANASNNANFALDVSVTGRRSGALSLCVPRSWLDDLHVSPLGGATAFRLAQNRPLRSLKAHCQSLGIASVVRPWLPVLMHKDTALMAAGIGVNWEAFAQAQAHAAGAQNQRATDQTLLELRWDDTNDCRRAFL
jgi:tRNA(Ile)-lysidine synthase